MKKLTLLLAMLSLIVGALFLSACSEPMSSETDDGLTDRMYGINGYVYDDDMDPVPSGVTVNLYPAMQAGNPLDTDTTNSNGLYNFISEEHPNGWYRVSCSWNGLYDSVIFQKTSPTIQVDLYLE